MYFEPPVPPPLSVWRCFDKKNQKIGVKEEFLRSNDLLLEDKLTDDGKGDYVESCLSFAKKEMAQHPPYKLNA